jgi:hypothetical protein
MIGAILFQSYCKALVYDSVKPTEANFTVKRTIGTSTQSSLQTEYWKMLGGCSGMKKVDDVTVSARTEELVLFTPYSQKDKLVNFGYRKQNVYYLFQATIGREHSANAAHICEWLVHEINATMPSLLINHNSKEVIETIVGVPQFELYFVVPEFLFENFSVQPANATIQARKIMGETFGKNTLIYAKWNEILSVYIACYKNG